jgi:hypothetical protein
VYSYFFIGMGLPWRKIWEWKDLPQVGCQMLCLKWPTDWKVICTLKSFHKQALHKILWYSWRCCCKYCAWCYSRWIPILSSLMIPLCLKNMQSWTKNILNPDCELEVWRLV